MGGTTGAANGRAPSHARGQAADRWLGLAPQAMRNMLLVALALTSGYVDAVSYLGLGAVFTSNMTGNTVLLGLALAQSQGLAGLRSGVALVGFVVGVAIGAPIVRRARKDEWPRAVTVACVVEFAVLLALAIWGALLGSRPVGEAVYPLIALAAIAMGLQSVAVRALGVPGVVTTYITGTWVSLIAEVMTLLTPPFKRIGQRQRRQQRQQSRRKRSGARASEEVTATASSLWSVALQAAVVGVYVVAAFLGGAAELRWRSAALTTPAIVVALVVAAALPRWRRSGRNG
ncbi:MAG TPA: YoaK family protein [Ktedonobacterales bacterium]|nr:YoaK family protein [Ktedonobacterales bacterium]